MIDILDRIAKLIGETTTIVIIIHLLILAVASEIWEWIVWVKLRRERPPSQVRTGSEITSLVAGTTSMMLFACFFLGLTPWLTGWKEWAINLWIFGGAGLCWLALVASGICRGRVRIAGIVVGMLMGWFWWGLWSAVEYARAWVNSVL